jgi:hypothetical protein
MRSLFGNEAFDMKYIQTQIHKTLHSPLQIGQNKEICPKNNFGLQPLLQRFFCGFLFEKFRQKSKVLELGSSPDLECLLL